MHVLRTVSSLTCDGYLSYFADRYMNGDMYMKNNTAQIGAHAATAIYIY